MATLDLRINDYIGMMAFSESEAEDGQLILQLPYSAKIGEGLALSTEARL